MFTGEGEQVLRAARMGIVRRDAGAPVPVADRAGVVLEERVVNDQLRARAVRGEKRRDAELVGGVVTDPHLPQSVTFCAVASVLVDRAAVLAGPDLVLPVVHARALAGVAGVCTLADCAVAVEEAVEDEGSGPEHPDGAPVARGVPEK